MTHDKKKKKKKIKKIVIKDFQMAIRESDIFMAVAALTTTEKIKLSKANGIYGTLTFTYEE